MRKAIVIIVAVAILGVLAVFNNKHTTSTATTSESPSSVPVSDVPTQEAQSSQSAATTSTYKDGTYTGSVANNLYGPVQVAAVISGGKITDIKYLQMPSDEPESRRHTVDSEPLLKQSALTKQSANIDFVSGATDTSISFKESLQAALNQAANS